MGLDLTTGMNETDRRILEEIRFGFLYPYRVAGMGEPWHLRFERTQQLLAAQGIGGILTLTEDDLYGEQHRAAGFLHHHESIDDCEPPATSGMDRAIKFMDDCLEKDFGVAVHCLEGRGRTGTVLCAWVGLKESLRAQNALERIYTLRHHTVLTQAQRLFLYQYLGDERNTPND